MLNLKKLTTMIAAAAMTFSLAACGEKRLTEEEKAKIAGTYELTAFEGQDPEDPNAVTEEDLKQIKEHGYPCTLAVNEDGTAVLDLFGDTQNLTWGKTAFSTNDGSTIAYTVSDDTLTLSQESTTYKMVFTRLDIPAQEEVKEDAPAEATEATEEKGERVESAEEVPEETSTEENSN